MYSYIQFGLYLLAAEFLRRAILILKVAYTGPLSKIPGPWWGKLTHIPWMIENVTGNSMNSMPRFFEKYGEVVRIGTCCNGIHGHMSNMCSMSLLEEQFVCSGQELEEM
jgi:hypothetical protein